VEGNGCGKGVTRLVADGRRAFCGKRVVDPATIRNWGTYGKL
jgi:hypothetical protein